MRKALFAFFCLLFVVSGFRFAVISDIHIGKGQSEYKGQETEQVLNLRKDVEHIEKLHQSNPIDFVLISGDISDKSQVSQFEKARDVLSQLSMPFLPLIGNHDIWSYHKQWKEEFPTGDKMFTDTFAHQFSSFGGALVEYAGGRSVPNPESHHPSHFQNFVLEKEGLLVLGLDWVSRFRGPHRAATNAELHNFPGGTLDWLNETLSRIAQQPGAPLHQVVLVQHHPFRCSWKPSKEYYYCFSTSQLKRFQGLVLQHAGTGRIPAVNDWFGVIAGHMHRWYSGKAFHHEETTQGPFRLWQQWETPATRWNPCLSVVHVEHGRIEKIEKWGEDFHDVKKACKQCGDM